MKVVNTPILVIGSEQELSDLTAWALREKPTQQAGNWLLGVSFVKRPKQDYPLLINFPEPLIVQMEEVINDWEEVLSSHPHEKDFHTYVLDNNGNSP
jgi:hypothetical protein